MTPAACFVDAFRMSIDCTVAPLLEPSVAACPSGIHREKGVRSTTSLTYQIFFVASQRAPRALAVSFSANGTFKSILMGELSAPCSGFTAFASFGQAGAQTVYLWETVVADGGQCHRLTCTAKTTRLRNCCWHCTGWEPRGSTGRSKNLWRCWAWGRFDRC